MNYFLTGLCYLRVIQQKYYTPLVPLGNTNKRKRLYRKLYVLMEQKAIILSISCPSFVKCALL